MTDPWLFILALIAILGAPGPTNTLLATAGVTATLRRSLALVAAALGGYIIAIALIRTVLGPMLAAAPVALVLLKVAVAAYLAWIAVDLWRRSLRLGDNPNVGPRQVFVATLLNPKAIIISLTVFPQEPLVPTIQLGLFVSTMVATGLAWIVVGRTLTAAAGAQGARIIPRVAAAALGGFAGLILYSAFS